MMAKHHRGKGIRHLVHRGRGTCPLCQRTGVKLLYTLVRDGDTLTVCKRCRQK
ncbi:MAG: hypothetical protein K8J31_30420 [Anaerolineae bacterium]|nr:hypothetical protein [Anaerolineae bacterium]